MNNYEHPPDENEEDAISMLRIDPGFIERRGEIFRTLNMVSKKAIISNLKLCSRVQNLPPNIRHRTYFK